MNTFLNGLKSETNFTETENGAVALNSTMNSCLDMFGSFGAMRFSTDDEIIRVFSKAFSEDRAFATKMLFYFRDIRAGQGTRRQFRVILQWLAENAPEYVINNLDNIILFGRGDDYLCLLDTSVSKKVTEYLQVSLLRDVDSENPSLLAKWLPSINTSSNETKRYAKMLVKAWGWSEVNYRKTLSKIRAKLDVVEKKMSAGKWNKINYEAVPAKAAALYSDAFYKHDEHGYEDYIVKVASGDAKINAASLYPVDIVHRVMNTYKLSNKDIILNNAQWKSLPNYFEGKEESSICVVDVSGSMSGTPMEVAISLGLYCADNCKGPFKDHFITFSERPSLVEVKGVNINEKVGNMERAGWGGNTDLEAVFDLILRTAIRNNCKQEDLPNKLYIISDMQFDEARGATSWFGRKNHVDTFMQTMKQKFIDAGYVMPSIVYWNVRASECGMFQETFEGENCCMVSGYSASLFKAIMEGTTYEEEVVTKVSPDGTVTKVVNKKEVLDPLTVMKTTINNERYDVIWTK